MRRFFVAVGLTAVLTLPSVASGFAAGTSHKAKASTRSKSETTSVAEASGTPANCVRESCGRLWCWHMRGETSGK